MKKISDNLRLLANHAEQLEADGVTRFWASAGTLDPCITLYDTDAFRRKFAGREAQCKTEPPCKNYSIEHEGVMYRLVEYFEASSRPVTVTEVIEAPTEPVTA